MKGKAKKLERWLVALAILTSIFALLSVGFRIPVSRVVLLAAVGRLEHGCSLRLSITDDRYERARMAARLQVSKESELIRTDGGLMLWRSPYGRAWTQNSGDSAFWAADLHHWPPRWAHQARPLPVEPVNKGDTVIDAGGHIGESSLAALRMGAATVISIEPDPLNAEAIRRNLEGSLNEGRLIVVEEALSDKAGVLTLQRHDASTRSTVAAGSTEGIQVPVTTLDELVTRLNLQRVDFIKMDIEGSEQNALRGSVATLRRFKPVLAIGSYHRPDDIMQIPRIVSAIVPEYRIAPLRCLLSNRQIFPHLLYFFVPGGVVTDADKKA